MKKTVCFALLLLLLASVLAGCACPTCAGAGKVTCTNCDGVGSRSCISFEYVLGCLKCLGKKQLDCEACDGTGRVVRPNGETGFLEKADCHECESTGKVPCTFCVEKHDCDACDYGVVLCTACNATGQAPCPNCKRSTVE